MKNSINRFLNLARIAGNYFFGLNINFYPLKILVEPTNACNLRCIMCPRTKMNRKVGNMDLSLFKKIVDESKDFVKEYQLSQNGEPLMNNKIFEMIKYARSNGVFTSFFSNGTLLDESKGRKIIDSGLDRILITIDGATKETYEKIRVNANFERTVSNIENFLKLKSELGSKKPEFILQIIKMKETESEIPRFIEKFKHLPVDHIRVRPFDTWAGDADVIKHAPSKIVKRSRVACTQLWTTMPILWDGRVVPCCRDYDGFVVLGDVSKSHVFDVWNGPKAKSFRKNHTGTKLCADCLEWDKELRYSDVARFVASYIRRGSEYGR